MVEYEGEWGCIQFAEETGGARRSERVIVAKLALLSVAFVAFGNSEGCNREGAFDCGEREVCAAVRNIRHSKSRHEPAREQALLVRRTMSIFLDFQYANNKLLHSCKECFDFLLPMECLIVRHAKMQLPIERP